MKKLIGGYLRKHAGKSKMQRMYNALFHLGLSGMNYGQGADFKDSGELYVLQFINKKLQEENNLVLFDVGANVGGYTKLLAGIFKPGTIIHAFEPSKKTYEIYTSAIDGMNNIIANNLGVSDTETQHVLYTDSDGSGLASLYSRNLKHLGIAMDKTETIELTTIDKYCHEKNIGHIHFLKLDIEGNELNALKGAGKMINNNKIDFIQFEFGGCNIDSRTFFQDFYYLLKDHYRLYRVLKDGLADIPVYKETCEIFITTNYLAIKKGL